MQVFEIYLNLVFKEYYTDINLIYLKSSDSPTEGMEWQIFLNSETVISMKGRTPPAQKASL